jgi:hypothetical protein
MSEVTDRLFSFSSEISPVVGYENFSQALASLSQESFPITDGMSVKERKIVIGNRASILLKENVILYDYAMEIIHAISNCDEDTFEEMTCF